MLHMPRPHNPFGRPFRANLFLETNPGLKPWAILLCHFVAFCRIAHHCVTHCRPSYPFTSIIRILPGLDRGLKSDSQLRI